MMKVGRTIVTTRPGPEMKAVHMPITAPPRHTHMASGNAGPA